MQIREVHIHNFRCIADAAIDVHDYLLLVGANNAGKSNVIDAIRAFYGDHKYSPAKDQPKFDCDDDDVWVEIEYLLTDDEHATIAEKYQRDDRRLTVRRYLDTSDKSRKDKLYAYVGDELAEEQFYGAGNVQKGKLGKIIYIPASSQIKDHMKTSGPSVWRDIVSDIFEGLVETSPSFASLTEHFDEFEEQFKQESTEDDRSLNGLIDIINTEIEEWNASFDLRIDSVDPAIIVKNLLRYQLLDGHLGNEELDEDQYGQGFQRHLIFTLLRVAAMYQTSKMAKKTKDFSPNLTLLLFEEPEAYLHPPQQTVLYRTLRTISDTESQQVIVTSHSPNFVSYASEEIPSIARLSRENGRTRIGQISETRLEEIFSDNTMINEIVTDCGQTVQDDDWQTDMEAVKYGVWLNSERCQMFFAERVVLVEGTTEQVLFNHLINSGAVNIPRGGVFILDCLGKWNLHRFMNLVGELNIPHSIVFDADTGEVHRRIAEMLEEIATPQTVKIRSVGGDIETLLGIEKTNKPHRKPQHVMLKLHQGLIPDKGMSAAIELLDDLLN